MLESIRRGMPEQSYPVLKIMPPTVVAIRLDEPRQQPLVEELSERRLDKQILATELRADLTNMFFNPRPTDLIVERNIRAVDRHERRMLRRVRDQR